MSRTGHLGRDLDSFVPALSRSRALAEQRALAVPTVLPGGGTPAQHTAVLARHAAQVTRVLMCGRAGQNPLFLIWITISVRTKKWGQARHTGFWHDTAPGSPERLKRASHDGYQTANACASRENAQYDQPDGWSNFKNIKYGHILCQTGLPETTGSAKTIPNKNDNQHTDSLLMSVKIQNPVHEILTKRNPARRFSSLY